MPGFAFEPGCAKYDVTPVENMFIEMYLPETSGEFLKVYLYGLMLCYRSDSADIDCAELARVLHTNEDSVYAALAYWQELGLLHVISHEPLEVRYVNLKDRFIRSAAPQQPPRERLCAELREQLQAMFDSRRVLAPAELALACQWMDELSFDSDLIVLLARYCMQRKGERVSFAYMDKLAHAWADRGIRTFAAGDAHIREQELAEHDVTQVLKKLGVTHRLPTAREQELYRTWTHTWGFDLRAILAASALTSSTLNPSFKYLDGILSRLHAQDIHSAEQITRQDDISLLHRQQQGELLRALGAPGGVLPEDLNTLLERMRHAGTSHAGLLQAAQLLARRGATTPADLQALLEDWLAAGITDDTAIAQECDRQAQAEAAVRGWLAHWGVQRAPAAREIAAYLRYTGEQALLPELVDYAAQCARNADRPLAYMATLLKDWQQAGITTAAQAADRQQTHTGTTPASAATADFTLQHDDDYYRRAGSDFDGLAGEA